MIGVEFGSNTMKMAVCDGTKVKKMAFARMPEDLVREGRVTSPAAMTEFLKNMMKENGIRGGNCAMVLPSSLVIGHHVTMPAMSESELKLNLPFEFRDFVGKDGAKYDYDYSVMGVKDNVMELYAAAVRKDVVEEYYSIFKKAGLTLKIAIPAEMAWANLIAASQNLPRKICIVDVGHNSTRVNIFVDGNFVMGKDIEMAGAMLDETIAAEQKVDAYVAHTRKEANMNKVLSEDVMNDAYQALAIEVMKIVNFYAYTDNAEGGDLEHLYYCGGSSVIEPLRTTLLKATGMTMHHVYRLVNMDDTVSDMALYCALAAGAAVQQ
jgi:type IV pilus assembly protein PilM